uniref:SH3 domain-containing protein n=2 Tax=unclassified Endozoicomonas TaxID=2644528 RepID=UPI003BB7AF64
CATISKLISMKKRTVIKRHKSNYPSPISFMAGEVVSIGKYDEEYPGWVWITKTDGNEGWAPVQFLEIDSNKGVATENYNAVELNTYVGETLLIEQELNEWGWAKNSLGSFGWVPLETLNKNGVRS